MKTKHTPGKWEAKCDGVFSKDEHVMGNIICEPPSYTVESMKYWDANAKLIAAVPDLLKIVNYIIEKGLEIDSSNRLVIRLEEEDVKDIWSLIKKATE